MLYSRNLITQSDSTAGYNTAVRQINATNKVNIEYLKKQYELRKDSYTQLQTAKTSLDNAIATLENYVNCLEELTEAL